MKTLAVIKNELFKDFLKIVSTDDLAKTLDNPDVPLPYECLDSVDNNNSDMLATELAQYFSQAKLPNKDFYRLDEDQSSQLSFMLNLIKVSSGGAPEKSGLVRVGRLPENAKLADDTSAIIVEEENSTMPSEEFATQVAPVLEETLPEAHFEEPAEEVSTPVTKSALRRLPEEVIQAEVNSTSAIPVTEQNEVNPFDKPVSVVTYDAPVEYVYDELPPASSYGHNPLAIDSASVSFSTDLNGSEGVETNSDIHEIAPIDEDDPFKFVPTEPAKKEEAAPVNPEVVEAAPEVEATVETAAPAQESEVTDNEVIASFGIPKNSTLHLVKNNAMTATLVDDNTVIFDGSTMTLGDAAKAALKKSGMLGIPNGLSGWSFEGKTLKELKDANA